MFQGTLLTLPKIRVYDLETSFCDILTGHTDMVLGIARSKNGDLLVSGSKDKNAILWRQEVDSARFDKIGQCSGHTEAVSAVAFSQKSAHFVVTGSQDLTIKLWDIQQENGIFIAWGNHQD